MAVGVVSHMIVVVLLLYCRCQTGEVGQGRHAHLPRCPPSGSVRPLRDSEGVGQGVEEGGRARGKVAEYREVSLSKDSLLVCINWECFVA